MTDAFLIEFIVGFIIASTFFGLLRGINKATKETAKNTKAILQILSSVDGKISNPSVGESLSNVSSASDREEPASENTPSRYKPLPRRERAWHKKEPPKSTPENGRD